MDNLEIPLFLLMVLLKTLEKIKFKNNLTKKIKFLHLNSEKLKQVTKL